LGGSSSSDIGGDKIETNKGEYDYWVIKLAVTGIIQWQNTIGGNDDDPLQFIQQTTDGGYILGGYSESGVSGDKTEASQGNYDYWVVKIQAAQNTNPLLATFESSDFYCSGTPILLYNTSALATTYQWNINGTPVSNNTDLNYTFTATGPQTVTLIATNGVCSDTLSKTIGISPSSINFVSNSNALTATFVASSGASSYTWNFGDGTTANNSNTQHTYATTGTYNVCLTTNTSCGNSTICKNVTVNNIANCVNSIIEWQNTLGGSSIDKLQSIKQTADGGYILGGYSETGISGDKTEVCQGSYDYWVVKLAAIGTIEWQNTIGGSSYDELQSIQQTTDGGYILGGYSYSGISGDKTEANQGGFDYWVVKLSATGTIEWQNTIGGSNDDYLQSIQQIANGGYILGGYSSSGISGDKTEAIQGNFGSDYWVIKLSATGTIQWQNTIGGSGYDNLQSIQQTTDGGYILGGYSESGISGDKTETNQGGFDYWVVKLSATGTIQWQNTIGGSGDDQLQSIQQTTNGGYILGGYSNSGISGDKTEASQGGNDYWVVKLSTTGTIEWQNTIGGSGEDQLQSIQQTTDGGYILGGYSYSGISGDKTEANQGSDDYNDYWVIKLSATGTIQWQNTIGGNGDDYLLSIQQTTDGGYILGGYSNSGISGDKTEINQGGSDYWVIKLSSNGTIQWQNTIGGSSGDFLRSIQQTTDGGYILGGYSQSGISGDKTEINQGDTYSSDYWVIKLSATGTIEWQNTIGGTSSDQLQSIQQTTDGGYILGGYSNSGISGDKTEINQGDSDYWVIKLSSNGTIQWQNTIGGIGGDELQSIQQTADGGYIFGGYSISGISGDKTEAAQNYSNDYWVVKLPPITYVNFSASVGAFAYPYVPITFTNISTYATSYEWQVDGVPVSTDTNLTYTFPTGGTHTITLVASNGECVDTYSQTINVLTNAVWPGDANADGTVNMLDYLALGIAYNHVDVPRLEQNIDWNAKFATNFNQTFGGNLFANTNYKHSDCNGNGTINFADTTAVLQNFGLSYLPATTLAPSVSPQALVSVEANTPYVAASAVAFLNIKLQNALDNNNPVNLYGMAFSIDYTGASNPQLNFAGSCLGTLGTDFIASYKIDDANKKIHVGITRFNHNNSLASGTVATLQLNINALPTGTSLAIGTEDIVLCDNEGYRIPAAAGVAANMQVQTSALPVMLQAKALLQCAITDLNVGNALMTTEFNSTLPTQQPFNAAPWNYTGTESGTIPANAVDWLLVELRNSANINQVVARKAVLLLNDGSLQDVGTPLQNNRVAFVGLASNQSYFVVLRHRSHQTITSSAAVPVSNNLMSIDFTQSADQTNGGAASLAYINGWYALKLVLTPTLSGNTTVCSGTTQTYTNSTPVAGVTYTWTATGGSIVSGQGGNSVQIQWANGTSGTLTLTAEEHLCSEVVSASITVSLTPDAIITVGGTAAGGGTPGLTSYNLCPTCKVYLKSNYTNLTNYTLKWYKNNNELTQYQNYLGGYVKKAGNYKLKVIRNSTGCEDFSQIVTVTGGAPMLADNINPNINNTPSMGKDEELLFESENLELFVYPNPAQNRVTIAYNIADNSQLSLKIYDIMGQLQHTQTLAISNNTLDVDVSTYPSGTYLVQLLGDKASVVSYLMVVK
jgi:PKD repeat protein